MYGRKRVFGGFFGFVLLAVLFLAVTHGAQAATITPFSKTAFAVGTEILNEGFTVPVAGTYTATILDFVTPGAFDTLLFALTTASPITFIDFVDGAGSMGMFTFLGEPGVDYVANIAAITGEAGIGLFGAEVSLMTPIPQAAVLLGSGLLGLLILGFRIRKAKE